MNQFEKMIEDIFRVPEFISSFFTQDGKEVICISYEKSTDGLYSEFGFDDGISFYLTCKKSDYTPKKGEKITYKGEKYKIDNFTLDGFDLSYKIFLKGLSSK